MKVVIAPDSFKGSLSAPAVAHAMAAGVRRVFPEAEIVLKPMADGGEGTLDIILSAAGGKRGTHRVIAANGVPVDAAFGVIEHRSDRLGIIETAQVIGLHRVDRERDPVGARTTTGVGQLFLHLLDEGVLDVVLAVGGTSTNDGGAGFLEALGVELLDACGARIAPTVTGLRRLTRLGFARLDERVCKTKITLLSDVTNPLLGPEGATAVYGPQKGVAAADVLVFDAALARLALLGDAWVNRPLSREPGAGAAGGLGYAALLLGARRASGAKAVAEWCGLDEAIAGADLVLTGEGRSDLQTLQGKVPMAVAQLAKDRTVPVMLVSGDIDAPATSPLSAYFNVQASLVSDGVPPAVAIRNAASLLTERVAQALHQWNRYAR